MCYIRLKLNVIPIWTFEFDTCCGLCGTKVSNLHPPSPPWWCRTALDLYQSTLCAWRAYPKACQHIFFPLTTFHCYYSGFPHSSEFKRKRPSPLVLVWHTCVANTAVMLRNRSFSVIDDDRSTLLNGAPNKFILCFPANCSGNDYFSFIGLLAPPPTQQHAWVFVVICLFSISFGWAIASFIFGSTITARFLTRIHQLLWESHMNSTFRRLLLNGSRTNNPLLRIRHFPYINCQLGK